jgi:hypothetical protein
MEELCSFNIFVNLCQDTRLQIPEDITLHSHCCGNLKSHEYLAMIWHISYNYYFEICPSFDSIKATKFRKLILFHSSDEHYMKRNKLYSYCVGPGGRTIPGPWFSYVSRSSEERNTMNFRNVVGLANSDD